MSSYDSRHPRRQSREAQVWGMGGKPSEEHRQNVRRVRILAVFVLCVLLVLLLVLGLVRQYGRDTGVEVLGATASGSSANGAELVVRGGPGTEGGETVSRDIFIPRDMMVFSASELSLFDAGGSPVPCEVTVIERWDGPATDASKAIKWVLVELPAGEAYDGDPEYKLRRAGAGASSD